MLVSGRAAAGLLAEIGLPREQARRLLLAGLAGDGIRAGGALLYDEDRVRQLRTTPIVDPDLFTATCPKGAFVLRAWRGVQVSLPHAEQVARLRLAWWLSAPARVLIGYGIETFGYYPFLVTVSGFIARGGEITALRTHGPRVTELVVTESGTWYDTLRGQRLDVGIGGPWVLWAARGWTGQGGLSTPGRLQE